MTTGRTSPRDAGARSERGPGPPASTVRRRTWRHRLLRATVLLVVVALVVFGAAAWYFAGQIRSSALEVAPLHERTNVVVTDAGSGWVALRKTSSLSEELASDHVYGLDWGSGFGLLHRLRGTDHAVVSRELEVLSGTPPTEGTAARVTRDAYPLRAAAVLGFGYRDVTYRSPAGTFPAYFAPGTRDTWAILVHGRGATRAEMFRLMKATVAAGLPSLDITYRHDGENGGGLARFGQDEWPDLEAAVRYALDRGARNVVLVGTSMGAAITAAFEEHSSLAARVVAVVLDSPMLDFAALIDYGARDKRLPGLGTPIPGGLVWAARHVAGLRYDLDQGQLDYLDDTSWVRTPVLAIHGTADPTVPVSLTRRLHAARPDRVTTFLVRGARHVESWNGDPSAYESRVATFLDDSVGARAG